VEKRSGGRRCRELGEAGDARELPFSVRRGQPQFGFEESQQASTDGIHVVPGASMANSSLISATLSGSSAARSVAYDQSSSMGSDGGH
jgi:hypothetical protein